MVDDTCGGSGEAEGKWGGLAQVGFWFNTVVFMPVIAFAAACVSSVVAVVVAMVLALPIIGEHRLSWSPLDLLADVGLAPWWVFGGVLGAALAVSYWIRRSPVQVTLYEDRLVRWSATGRRTLYFKDVVRAFVTVPPYEGATSRDITLHLSTRWRDVTIPLEYLLHTEPSYLRRERFDTFVQEVQEALGRYGKHVERGIPVTSVNNDGHPLLYAMYWPHRRVLSQRAIALDSDTSPAYSHNTPLRSLSQAWLWRPAPVVFGLLGAVCVLWVRYGTTTTAMPIVCTGVGLFLAPFAIPVWNLFKDTLIRMRARGGLMPEGLIGKNTIEELPGSLRPAPGCIIDLEKEAIHRPDGLVIDFDAIRSVEYGPSSERRVSHNVDALQRAIASTAWHVAVTRGGADRPVEIYSNASVDIVRYGDLDAGYAAFNWVAIREVAHRAGAQLTLANGRVASAWVGRPLSERLERDVTRYDPEPILERMATPPRVHIREDDGVFEVWGPLTRQPEHCATPPLWKALFAALALVLAALAYPPAGWLAGYLIAACLSEGITAAHFARPGFRMDRQGVWVRGEVIAWSDLEELTLMPIAPGPILFCGSRTVLVAGHLGGSYNERAYLGCAAYRWIRRNVTPEWM